MPCGQTRQTNQQTSRSTSSTSQTRQPNLFDGLMNWLGNYVGQGTTTSGSSRGSTTHQTYSGSASQRRRTTTSQRGMRRGCNTMAYDGTASPSRRRSSSRGHQEWLVLANYDDYGFDGQEGLPLSPPRRQLSAATREKLRQRANSMPRDPKTGRFMSSRRR